MAPAARAPSAVRRPSTWPTRRRRARTSDRGSRRKAVTASNDSCLRRRGPRVRASRRIPPGAPKLTSGSIGSRKSPTPARAARRRARNDGREQAGDLIQATRRTRCAVHPFVAFHTPAPECRPHTIVRLIRVQPASPDARVVRDAPVGARFHSCFVQARWLVSEWQLIAKLAGHDREGRRWRRAAADARRRARNRLRAGSRASKHASPPLPTQPPRAPWPVSVGDPTLAGILGNVRRAAPHRLDRRASDDARPPRRIDPGGVVRGRVTGDDLDDPRPGDARPGEPVYPSASSPEGKRHQHDSMLL